MKARLIWLKRHWLISMVLCVSLAGAAGGGVWLFAAIHHVATRPPGGACGMLRRGYVIKRSADPQMVRADAQEPIVDCFWQAYAVCAPATLTSLEGGVDTSYRDDLTIVGHEQPCTISVSSDHWVNVERDIASYRCTGLTKQNTWLVLANCDQGHGLTLNPDMPSSSCNANGTSRSLYDVPLSPAQERCFLQGLQFCYARSVDTYDAIGNAGDWSYWINSHCRISISNSNPSVAAACHDFKQTADGLSFLGCGQFGDRFVPVSL